MRFSLRLLAPLTILLAALAAYAGNLGGPFLFDDVGAIEKNATLDSLVASLSPPSDTSVAGRPLANLSLAVNAALDALTPLGVRRGNWLLHAVASLLVLGVVRQALRAPRIPPLFGGHAPLVAWGTAVLFAVHPLSSECLYYAVQRTELVLAVCLLATCYASLRALAGDGRGWVVAAVLACALGMTAKATMVATPVLLFLFVRAFDRGTIRETWRAQRGLWIGLAATIAIQFVLQMYAPRNASVEGPSGAYLLAQSRLIPRYIASMVWPAWLVLDHGPLVPGPERVTPATVFTGLLVLATLVGTITHPRAAWPAAWVLGLLAPSSSLITITTEVGADRRAYLPMIAVLAIILALPFLLFARNSQSGRTAGRRAWMVGVVVLALTAIKWTRERATPWQSAGTFWARAIEEAPGNPRAWKNRADLLRRGGRVEDAIASYRRAIALDTKFTGAHANLGMYLAERGRAGEATMHLERAVAAAPENFPRQRALGLARLDAGDASGAVAAFEAALALRAGDVELRSHLGRALHAAERSSDALGHLRAIVKSGRARSADVVALVHALQATEGRAAALGVLEQALRGRPQDRELRKLRRELQESTR